MTFARLFPLLLVGLMAGCASQPDQFLVEAPTSGLRLRPLVASVEVRDMSLPRYATADGLTVQTADGALTTDTGRVWADNLGRAGTLSLVRNIGTITGARVAGEPWPFAEPPGASVSVAVETFLPRADGRLELSGSYAIASFGGALADRGGRFDISVPLPPEPDSATLARAHGTALRELSEIIARRIAR